MSMTLMIFIGLSLAVMFLFFYMFLRDKEIEKKFHFINESLENINQEIYKIQKQQEKDNLAEVRKIIAEELNVVIEDVLRTMQEHQLQNKREIDMLVDRVLKIETNVKTMALPQFEPPKKDNTEQIRELYEMGLSIEDIAKETGMNAGEVQFILKTLKFS